MTENNIREEWEKHCDDSLSKEQLDKAFDRVMARAEMSENAYEKVKANRSGNKMKRIAWISIAAAVTFILVPQITLLINRTFADKDSIAVVSELPEEPAHFCEVYTHNGETREVILPDNSKVRLNAGSLLIYPEKFSSAGRSVYLSGEAVFEVTHDDNVSFTVSTSDIDIQVHGTIFNVNSYPEDNYTSATLCEGSISAVTKSTGENILLTPRQRITFDRETGKTDVRAVNPSEDIAWMNGDMCFRSADIHHIARAIERKYGITVYVTSGKHDDMILTAKFIHGETLEQMLNAVSKLIPGMKYRIENGSVYIQ